MQEATYTQTELMADGAIAEITKQTQELFDLVANVPDHLLSRINTTDLLRSRDRELKSYEESYGYRQKEQARVKEVNEWFAIVTRCLRLEEAVKQAWDRANVDLHVSHRNDPYMTVEIPGDGKYTRTVATITPTISYSVSESGRSWRSRTTTGLFVEVRIDNKLRRFTVKDYGSYNWDKLSDTITDEVERHKAKLDRAQAEANMKRNQFERTQDDFQDLVKVEKEEHGYYGDSYRRRDWRTYETFNGKGEGFGISFGQGPTNDEQGLYNISLNISSLHVDVAREIIQLVQNKLAGK